MLLLLPIAMANLSDKWIKSDFFRDLHRGRMENENITGNIWEVAFCDCHAMPCHARILKHHLLGCRLKRGKTKKKKKKINRKKFEKSKEKEKKWKGEKRGKDRSNNCVYLWISSLFISAYCFFRASELFSFLRYEDGICHPKLVERIVSFIRFFLGVS